MPPVQKEFSMSTESRLNKLFHSSPVVPYDCLSRFVIMSDCHRGVGNWGDNFLKNETIYNAALTPQNEKEKTEESRAGSPLSLYIDSRIFLAAACSMSCFASSLLPRSADTMI